MRYRSTRGGVSNVSFEDAVCSGYAPDGGLFVPEALPSLDIGTLEQWRRFDFTSLAEAVLAPFIEPEVPRNELAAVLRECYAVFDVPEVVPVLKLGQHLFVSELFRGPTQCFKDLGQGPLVKLIARFAEQRRRKRSLLVSTTGDTGPAAMRAVAAANSPWLSIVVFFPKGQISDLQRRQMTTCSSSTASVVTFDGGGDDMDKPLKRLAADSSFASRHGLVGANSYNIGRPLMQMVHYFWTYFRVLDMEGLEVGSPVDIVIPTGAMGNIAGGFMAKNMGLPLRRLAAGVNSNDITHRTFSKGEFHRSDQMEMTLSDAINIQVPYNMERIFYYLTGGNTVLVSSWMQEMDKAGRLTLPSAWLAKLQEVFSSRRVDDAAMCKALESAWREHNYLVDPHTAVGLSTAWSIYGADRGDSPSSSSSTAAQVTAVPVAVLATASPCKFEASVTQAVGPKAWSSYVNGAQFPDGARKVMAAKEVPPLEFKRSSGESLELSQKAWEAKVREMLDDPGSRVATAKL